MESAEIPDKSYIHIHVYTVKGNFQKYKLAVSETQVFPNWYISFHGLYHSGSQPFNNIILTPSLVSMQVPTSSGNVKSNRKLGVGPGYKSNSQISI